jgi:hypothetical protein
MTWLEQGEAGEGPGGLVQQQPVAASLRGQQRDAVLARGATGDDAALRATAPRWPRRSSAGTATSTSSATCHRLVGEPAQQRPALPAPRKPFGPQAEAFAGAGRQHQERHRRRERRP